MNDSTAGDPPVPTQQVESPLQKPSTGRGTRKRRSSSLVVKIIAFTLSLVFTLIVAEIAVRLLTSRNEKDLNIEMWRYARLVKRTSENPSMSHEHIPGASAHLMGVDVRINSQGLRGKEYPVTKPPGTFRILVLGDSMTFGWGVPEEDTYPARLEASLNQSHTAARCKRFEVLNSGVGNYNSVQEITYFKELGKDWHPDLVILSFFINDAEPTPKPIRQSIANYSQLYVFLAGQHDRMTRITGVRPKWLDYYHSLYAPDAPGWKACQEAIAELASLRDKYQFKLVIAVIPELHQLGKNYPFRAEHDEVRKLAERANVPVWDLLPMFDGVEESSLWVTPEDTHANSKGNELLAQGILQQLVPYLEQQGVCAEPKETAPGNE